MTYRAFRASAEYPWRRILEVRIYPNGKCYTVLLDGTIEDAPDNAWTVPYGEACVKDGYWVDAPPHPQTFWEGERLW